MKSPVRGLCTGLFLRVFGSGGSYKYIKLDELK